MWQKQSQGIMIVLKHFFKVNICKLSFFHLIIWVRFPYVHLTTQIFILNNLFCLFIFLRFFTKFFFIGFDGYYIVRTDGGQPRPKYIFNKCETNIYFLYSTEVWSKPSPNFKRDCVCVISSHLQFREKRTSPINKGTLESLNSSKMCRFSE